LHYNVTGTDVMALSENILETIAVITVFGTEFKGNDIQEFQRIFQNFKEDFKKGLPSDISPILGYLLFWRKRNMRKRYLEFLDLLRKYYEEANAAYRPGKVSRCMKFHKLFAL